MVEGEDAGVIETYAQEIMAAAKLDVAGASS
jgi:hypothetical protein